MSACIIIDVIILAIIALNIFIGRRKGLIKTIFGCLTIIAALILANALGPVLGNVIFESGPVSGWVDKTTDGFEENIESSLQNTKDTATSENKINVEDSSSFGTLSDLAKLFNVDISDYLDNFNSGIENSLEVTAQTAGSIFRENVVIPFVRSITNLLGTVIVFIVSFIVVKIIGVFANQLFNIKKLKKLNQTGGMIAGGILGIFYVFALCTLLQIILPHVSIGFLHDGMESETLLYRLFTAINPIYAVLFG